jgi:hypothetical protein
MKGCVEGVKEFLEVGRTFLDGFWLEIPLQ